MSSKTVTLSVRTNQETKDKLAALVQALNVRLGTRVTQTQALEMAITLALGAEAAMAKGSEDE